MEIETSPLQELGPWIKVVVCEVLVMEIQGEIEPESPLSVRPARYEGIPGSR